jgi:hypothetical protein
VIKKLCLGVPTSEQIVSDFANYPDILQKIVDANGCVVDDLRLRSGRRFLGTFTGHNSSWLVFYTCLKF